MNISSAGTCHAPDLESQNATIVIGGTGGVTVWAKKLVERHYQRRGQRQQLH